MGSPVSACTIFKIAGARPTAAGARVVLGNCSTVFGGQSRPWRGRPIQHPGNSSSIVADGDDLRRQRIPIPAMLDKRRTSLGQACGGVHWAGACDWGDRVSDYGDRLKKQAAGKKGRRGNQCAGAPERHALRSESGLSASLFLCESAGEIRELREEAARERALLSRST